MNEGADTIDILLAGGEQADAAMYHLLHARLEPQLRKHYEGYRQQLLDGFDDVVDDFFLYLRNGKDGRSSDSYGALRSIRQHDRLDAWLIATFRNYLNLRAAREGRLVGHRLQEGIDADSGADEYSPLTDEQKLAAASHLVAYTHQTLSPREAFILLRMLLTLLNRQRALSNDEVARGLGMSPVAYRVTVHRVKRHMNRARTRLLQGHPLPLDEAHRAMAQRLYDDFLHLYPTLMTYYLQSIDSLRSADEVRRLRQEYLDATGKELHEDETSYSFSLTITSLWDRIDALLADQPS